MKVQRWILPAAIMAVVAGAPVTQASVLVNTDFNNASLASNGLYNGSYEVNPTFAAGKGIAGNTALDFGNSADGGVVYTPYLNTVSPVINFSLDALYQAPTGSGPPGALAVTWSNIPNDANSDGGLDSGERINASTDYGGPGGGYPQNSLVGLGINGTNTASLAANSGQAALQSLYGNGIWYGGATAALQTGHWYQFSGTIWYDPSAGAFNFVSVALTDLGTTGQNNTGAVLGGGNEVRTSFASNFPQSDGTDEPGGRLGFMFSGGSGFEYVNNIYADTGSPDVTPHFNSLDGSWSLESVPEPGSLGLLLVGGICLLARRRGAGRTSGGM